MLILSGAVLSAEQLAAQSVDAQAAYRAAEAALVRGPYLALAAVLLGLAGMFALARLPKIVHNDGPAASGGSVLAHKHLVLGAVAIFLYVGGEVSIGSFLINFLGEADIGGLAPADAARYVTFYWGGAMVGRFIGFAVMRYVSPGKTLAFNAASVIVLILLAVLSEGSVAMWAIIGVGLFNSIMFPTIFSMAMHRLGGLTGQGSGILCMAIVGGAIVPFLQGAMADSIGLQLSFLIPAACYAFILYYGIRFANLYSGVPAGGGH
jgi:MFS transporter, FHS family, L-fucose permease